MADNGVTLLAGGNPQIPKGDGDPAVPAYLRAMPDWTGDIGRHLHGLITEVARLQDWIGRAADLPGDNLF